MHTRLSPQGAHTPPPICLLGAQGTRWSSVPFYPQHLAGTWKNLCREELGEPASSRAALLSLLDHPSRQALLPPLLPGSPPVLLSAGIIHSPAMLSALAALGVFHLHLPHHSCLPGLPPTPCCPSGQELLETLSPIKVGAPDHTPIPHLPLV